MNTEFEKIVNQAIMLEKNVAGIYLIFKETFDEDADFWWQLVLEEEHHAALIKSAKVYFAPNHQFPQDLISSTFEELQKVNNMCQSYFDKYKADPPTREEAFNLALILESSAGEIHFQKFMMKNSDSEICQIFQQLNGEDLNHYRRIKSYMTEHNIVEQ
jgi:hypothetical protein